MSTAGALRVAGWPVGDERAVSARMHGCPARRAASCGRERREQREEKETHETLWCSWCSPDDIAWAGIGRAAGDAVGAKREKAGSAAASLFRQ